MEQMPGKAEFMSLIFAGMLGAAAIGCASAHAKSPPESPPLEMPSPPKHDIASADVEPPAPVGLVEEPARHTEPGTLRGAAAPSKPDSSRQDVPKPEAVPPPPQPEASKPVEEPPKPPTTLQMPLAGNESDVERSIRALLGRATADLNRVDTRALGSAARTQYEAAKGYVQKADDALRDRNFLFARSLAVKAADLAAQLAGR